MKPPALVVGKLEDVPFFKDAHGPAHLAGILPAGWRRTTEADALLFRGEDDVIVCAARVEWQRPWLLPASRASAVLVGPLVVAPGGLHTREQLAERWYRAVLDTLTLRSPAPAAVRVLVDENFSSDIDLLWRFAVALDARCQVRSTGVGLEVSVFARTLAGTIAGSLLSFESERFAVAVAERRRWLRRPGNSAVAGSTPLHMCYYALHSMERVEPIPTPGGLELREVPAATLAQHPGRFGISLQNAAMLSPSSLGFVGLIARRPVFHMWALCDQESIMRLPDTVTKVAEQPASLLLGARTDPRYRGRAIYPFALTWAVERLRALGYRTVLVQCLADNTPSIRGLERAGFRRIEPCSI